MLGTAGGSSLSTTPCAGGVTAVNMKSSPSGSLSFLRTSITIAFPATDVAESGPATGGRFARRHDDVVGSAPDPAIEHRETDHVGAELVGGERRARRVVRAERRGAPTRTETIDQLHCTIASSGSASDEADPSSATKPPNVVNDWSGPARATGGVFVASITTVSAGLQEYSSRTTTRTSYRPTLSAKKLAEGVVSPDSVATEPAGFDARVQDHSWIAPPFGSRATPSRVTPPRCTTRSGPASTVGAGSTAMTVAVSVLVDAPSLTVSCTTYAPGTTGAKAGRAVSQAARAPPPGGPVRIVQAYVRVSPSGSEEPEPSSGKDSTSRGRTRERQRAVGPRVRHRRPVDGCDLDEGRRAIEHAVVHDELGPVDALLVGNEQRRDGRRVGERGRALGGAGGLHR